MLPITLGIVGSLLLPAAVNAQTAEAQSNEIESEVLTWARVDFLRNRVQLVPSDQNGRRAQISDLLSVGDSLRTSRASRAELRFNDGSLARIGERATFRFTPNTRNFQLSNGTILLLIPPGRGRSTIQTPNAVTGIQGSALFVRYIPETDTTIVGALTDNPDGPMVLFNRDGTEQQALRANEIGVIEGDQITELYQFDGTLFWQSSGLAEGFNYLGDASSTGSDALDGVRQEIREAISNQKPITDGNVIVNPDSFARPPASPSTPEPGASGQTAPVNGTAAPEDSGTGTSTISDIDGDSTLEGTGEPVLEFEDSPAQGYLQGEGPAVDADSLEIGVNNSLTPSVTSTGGQATSGDVTSTPTTTSTTGNTDDSVDPVLSPTVTENEPTLPTPTNDGDDLIAAPSEPSTPSTPSTPPTVAGPGSGDGGSSDQGGEPVVQPLPPSALTDDTPDTPDTDPVVGPDVDPGTGPDVDPDVSPDVDPGAGPEVDPGAGPEVDPGAGPNVDPGAGPDVGPDTGGPDVAPDAGPDVGPDTGPDVAPDAGGPDIDPGVGPDVVPDVDPGAGPDVTPDIGGPDVTPDVGPDVGPDIDINDAPAGGSTVPSLILPEEIGSPDEMTVPPETLDATPAVVDDPTLLPVPSQVEKIDELPSPATDGGMPMSEEPGPEMPSEMEAQ